MLFIFMLYPSIPGGGLTVARVKKPSVTRGEAYDRIWQHYDCVQSCCGVEQTNVCAIGSSIYWHIPFTRVLLYTSTFSLQIWVNSFGQGSSWWCSWVRNNCFQCDTDCPSMLLYIYGYIVNVSCFQSLIYIIYGLTVLFQHQSLIS